MKLTATFLYSGLSDYWGGNGDRWEDNKGCLFANYSSDTTLKDIIDGWIDDWLMGGDCDTLHEDISDFDIRDALIEMLSDEGKKDYESGALSEFAINYAEANNIKPGTAERDDDCFGENPMAIVLIESTVCTGCGAWADLVDDYICEDCYEEETGENYVV